MADAALIWFRNDLRIADNPAFAEALKRAETVHALYVIETDRGLRSLGAAARAWLAHSLEALAGGLAEYGVALEVVEGESGEIVPRRARELGAAAVFWGRRYGPKERAHDTMIETALEAEGVEVASFNTTLLVEPWNIQTKSGGPYGVFSPFLKALRTHHFAEPSRAPNRRAAIRPNRIEVFEAEPAWARKVMAHWEPGEAGAKKALHRFIDSRLARYIKGRDAPAQDHTSQLSPHLRHGEISPRQIWFAMRHRTADETALSQPGEKFLAELAWREFNANLLYHRDDITRVPMQKKFEAMDWRADTSALHAWQEGRTGIPIVDAGMRQLWEIGWMHNRVRMIVGSLLSKNLLIDWRKGEEWFWDTLVDGDPANNPANWQWIAGVGADAAPYFRIFNPVTQGERFDPAGEYVRRWVPEIARLPNKTLHASWTAKADDLAKAGIILGRTYPEPIVDLKGSRRRALDAFGAV